MSIRVPPPPPFQPPPPPNRDAVTRNPGITRHPASSLTIKTINSKRQKVKKLPHSASVSSSITPPAPPRPIITNGLNTHSYSHSQPNTPPSTTDAPNSREMMQQQLYKTSSYNRIRKPSPRLPSNKTSLTMSKSATSLLTPQRPPPLPKHLLNKQQLRKLDLLPEIQPNKYIPPPPPHPTESFSSLTHEYNDNNNAKQHKRQRSYMRVKKAHSRGRSIGLEDAGNMWDAMNREERRKMDARTFNSLVLMQDIETYTVVFKSRVCGIELVPFASENNYGAVVIRCHTDYSKDKVKLQSVLVTINGEVCINSDYDEILSIISGASRPLILSFHPPTSNKNELRTPTPASKTPSDVMIWNDEEDDLEEVHQFMDPKTLFSKRHHNSMFIQKRYTMLYHKYVEMTQFQDLTKNIINDKMTEIKRLTKENMTLKTLLNTKQSELQKSQMNQSTEKQKGREILDKYQKLNEKNIFMERENIEQKQKIEQLQYALKQQKIYIKEHKRRAKQKKMAQKKTDYNAVYSYNKMKKRSKSPTNIAYNTKHGMNDNLQNELQSRLNIIQNDKLPKESPKQLQHYSEERTINHRNRLKKRGSGAINTLMRNIGIRKWSNPDESDNENDRYHPEISKMVREKKRRQKKNKKGKTNAMIRFRRKSDNSRVRSNSAESSLTNRSRNRKETIV